MQGAGHAADPIPTAFASTRYDTLMSAFGGDGYNAASAQELGEVCRKAFAAKRPAVVNVVLDPMAGVESGNVHAFNAPKAKM